MKYKNNRYILVLFFVFMLCKNELGNNNFNEGKTILVIEKFLIAF